jgi:hypothetical protein
MTHSAFLLQSLFENKPRPDIHSAVLKNATGIIGLELFGTAGQLDGIPLNVEPDTTVYYPHVAADATWWTGMALVNLESVPATVTLTAYDDAGNAVATQTVSLGAHAKLAKYAEEFFTQDIGKATYFTFSSDRMLAGFQLNGSVDGTMLDALAIQ